MTLILGTNLSDRIYLSGDTRLTIYNKGKFYSCHDNIIKTVPLNKFSGVSVAGTLKMAKFYFKRLKQKINIEDSILQIRENINNYIKEISDEYYYESSYNGDLCLIIGGINVSAKKEIKLSKFMKITKEYKGSMNLKEAIFQGLLGKDSRDKKKKVKLPPIIKLSVPDIKVFSVKININGFEIDDTEWGEIIAYGSGGITKKDIPEDAFSLLEIDSSAGQEGSDQAKMVAIMKNISEQSNNYNIGGAIFTCVISTVGRSGVLLGQIDRMSLYTRNKETINNVVKQRGNFYSISQRGVMTKLIPFVDYEIEQKIREQQMDLVL